MDQLISKQFLVALKYLLTKEGRGAQARLAKQQNIDRGYLNAIIKGRKPGSEKIRSQIASHFNMAYEDVYALGRRLLTQTEAIAAIYEKPIWDTLAPAAKEPITKDKSAGDAVGFKLPAKGEKGAASVQTRVLKTIEILESGTNYGDILAGLIDAFYDSLPARKTAEKTC